MWVPVTNDSPCPKCGSIKKIKGVSGPHIGLYCAECGHWFKWLPKKETNMSKEEIKHISEQMQPVTDEDIAKIYSGEDDLPWY